MYKDVPTLIDFKPQPMKKLDVFFNLDPNETVYYKIDIDSVQTIKEVKEYKGGSVSTNKIPFVNVSMNRRRMEMRKMFRHMDEGTLYLTNKRMLFYGNILTYSFTYMNIFE
ncbi:MAG: hypothetical protein DRP42_05385 [Tenericutes bacterium]|nr:MAG: hypothetical protein DRP42_05385 [Mycoplasmatota bacterium]